MAGSPFHGADTVDRHVRVDLERDDRRLASPDSGGLDHGRAIAAPSALKWATNWSRVTSTLGADPPRACDARSSAASRRGPPLVR
jgi:hypothetical protein